MENKGNVLMQKYDVGKLLGQGNFAKVYHGRNLETGQSVAIKVIDKEKIMKVGMIEQTKREISVMRVVKHPNVVEFYEVMATKTKIYFVMEYVKGGELFKKIAKGKLKEDMALKYFQQLISAVDYCHSRGVYHRDLKPENLLLDENGVLKVSDFGLSALVESRLQQVLLKTACGTPAYAAPEVLCRKGYDGAKADLWSCGVILFVLLAGYLPFHDSNLMEMYKKIGKAEYKCPSWFSVEVRKLLSRILNPNPSKRISIARVMENPWFRRGFKSQAITISKTEAEEPVPFDSEAVLGHYENSDTNSEASKELAKPANLNAFDIISLSTGFDLSGLFTENDEKRVAQFTSTRPASSIMSKLEDIARHLRLKIRKDRGSVKMEGSKEGRKGTVSIQAEIYEFTPSFHLVEVKKSSGDTLEYKGLMEKEIRPALQDIVWAWQGEQRQQEQ
ncbi:Calcium/calmodulin-dependent/calcium-dependent protein kinase [Trema orientale]|uniref:non-specific serine/threonine protein kinase n=1 Tax=Trema orientale TaxID=63057 RepID=A0A2P5EGL6_TREOI|nr:Calcium/calmodulin-dependent/calcium-dependent protein kinase [Trema orientale]